MDDVIVDHTHNRIEFLLH